MKITIQDIHFSADQKLRELIEKKVSKLEHFESKILEAQVYLKFEDKSHTIKEKEVEVKLHVPGDILFAQHSSKQFEISIDQVIDSLKKQIEKYKEKKS